MSSKPNGPEAEKLRAEADRLREEIKRFNRLAADARGALWKVEAKLRRLAIVAVVGVPDGVRVRARGMYGDRRVDDATGEVLGVQRIRCLVDWGPEIGRWRMPIDDLMPTGSGEAQGGFVAMGDREVSNGQA